MLFCALQTASFVSKLKATRECMKSAFWEKRFLLQQKRRGRCFHIESKMKSVKQKRAFGFSTSERKINLIGDWRKTQQG
jgi:hypothetical protein